jgi:putative flippase GtrA
MINEAEYPKPAQANVPVARASGFVMFLVALPLIKSTALARKPKEFERFLKFATVGVIGMVVDFTILNVCHLLLHLPLGIANAISFSTAVVSNFTWNRLWTFPESRQRPLMRQLGQFALVNLVGLIINTALLLGLDKVFQNFIPEPWSYNLAKVFAIGVVLFWNFFINRMWTYKGIE